MRIGLIKTEPKIVNTALMQISTYHKECGDVVEWCDFMFYSLYNKLYCSNLFDFTSKKFLPDRCVRGGTGFGYKNKLPSEIALCNYDYSIYPDCNYSIVWTSRGCTRKCRFCGVWKKEGGIHSVKPKNLNPNGKYIKLQDNNFFANREWPKAFKWLVETGQKIEFNSGIDVRIINRRQCEALQRLRIKKQLHTAWDNPKDDLVPNLQFLTKYIKPHRIMCYVLIGFWSTPEQDLFRVETLRNMGIDPFVMPYDKRDKYQNRFARWVNHKAIFESVKWKDYV